jgi:hypothetical protein
MPGATWALAVLAAGGASISRCGNRSIRLALTMENHKHKPINWRSRIVKSGKIKASELTPHPQNPVSHPPLQRDTVAASFDELGQIARVSVNINNGYLVDGEERAWLALDQPTDVELDCDWLDLTEEEHLKALVYLRATSELATYTPDVLDEILREVNSDSESIQMMLSQLAQDNNLLMPDDWKEYDETAADDVEYCTCPECGHRFPK